jgi:threonine dehydrogenase-like Zn-dependent dehydrogenase
MLGVTFPGEREVQILDFPDPTPGPGEVVLEIKASGMCGSDLRAYRAPRDLNEFRKIYKGLPTETMRDHGPRIMGHEPCGIVAEIGPGVTEHQARIGMRMMVHHYQGCGVCEQCRTGWTNVCEGMVPKSFGWTGHGGHAKYMKVPASALVALPDELSVEAGAAISCGSGTAYSALRRMKPNGTNTVAIFGQGPVGLAGTQFAVAMGCRVIALDINEDRLALAKTFGADATLNPAKVDVRQAIRDLTHGRGADFSLECSGKADAVVEAIRCLKLWGTAGLVGVGPGLVPVNIAADVVVRQVNIFGSLTFSSPIMAECARFSVDRKVPVDAIFTHRWRLEQAAEAYAFFDRQSTGKGVFLMQ